jgi:undecaprenyl-diphosphatase
MNFLQLIDHSIFKFINQTTANVFFDWLMPSITDLHLNKYFALFATSALFLSLFYKMKLKSFLYFLFLLLAIGTSDFTGAQIKRLVERPRPFQATELETIQRSPAGTNNSFYSNHATNNFAFATFTSFLFPQAKFIFFAIATTVAYSRVYNGVHYPSDILAGGLMGVFWGYLFYQLYLQFLTLLKRVKK